MTMEIEVIRFDAEDGFDGYAKADRDDSNHQYINATDNGQDFECGATPDKLYLDQIYR